MNTNHLNHQQLCDLLIDSTPDAASSAHLAECAACSAEFATLNTSLGHFRQASIEIAEREIQRRPLLLPARRRRAFGAVPAYAAAAAALAIVIILPLRNTTPVAVPLAGDNSAQVLSTPQPSMVAAIDDEAMLEELNRDLSASVPTPMEPLANPTGAQGNAR